MDNIKKFLSLDFQRFEENFDKAVQSNVPLLDKIMTYIVKSKGKRVRPMFVLLSAKLFGEVSETTYRAASLIELLHTATLVHDDVVDDANQRRSMFSINALWKNKIAVLVGDYLLSKGLLLSINNKDFTILEILSTAVSDMSEGELLQIEKARKLDITEEVYFDIISRKTASLLASSCSAGAYSANSNKEQAELMKQVGQKMGIAFQIKDDLFDYGNKDIGKPTGNDIKEKKMTLPLIYTLQNCDRATARKIKNIFKNENKNKEKISYIIDTVKKHNGIEYAKDVMIQYKNEALLLLTDIEESEAKGHFIDLINYTVDREY
jgi:octaprenyl-diphosphate synthase